MRVCPGCRTVYQEHIITCPKDGLPLIDRSPTFPPSKPGEAPPETQQPKEDTAVRPGLMIGEYQVEGVVAEGGMGVIYAGIHPLIRKRVAIKVLNKRFAQDPKAVSRFVLEARSVNEIGHHNIVDIFSIGELDDQRNYLIMEYLDGLALHEVLLKVKRLRPGEIQPIYEQLCDALKAAHAKGFVHRDLKPDNVVVLRRPPYPFIKILDFGLAKLRGSITSTNTEVGTVLGTPEYMAPEQCRGDNVDARTDVYALGVMLYELTTGRRPFTDNSPFRVLAMQQRETPKRPSRYSQIPEALEWCILRAMAKHPDQRFQTVEDLMQHLNHAVTERLTWTINLDPIAETCVEVLTPPPQEGEILTVLPPKPRGIDVPRPIAISDVMTDDEIETLVADSRPGMEQPIEILRMLRKEEHAHEIRGDVGSDVIAMPSVRNVRLAPVEARAPAPLLGTPDSSELEDMGATEVSDPPEVTQTKQEPIAVPSAKREEAASPARGAPAPAARAKEPPAPSPRPAPRPAAALETTPRRSGAVPAATKDPATKDPASRRSGTVPAATKDPASRRTVPATAKDDGARRRVDKPAEARAIAPTPTQSLANRPAVRLLPEALPLFDDPAPSASAAPTPPPAEADALAASGGKDATDIDINLADLTKPSSDVLVDVLPAELRAMSPSLSSADDADPADVESGVYGMRGINKAKSERETSSPRAQAETPAPHPPAIEDNIGLAKTTPIGPDVQQEVQRRLDRLQVEKTAETAKPADSDLVFDVEPPSVAELAQQAELPQPPPARWTPKGPGPTIAGSARIAPKVGLSQRTLLLIIVGAVVVATGLAALYLL